MYCGDNFLHENKGTNYQCLRRGIGIGNNQDNLEVYLSDPEQIIEKVYCGTAEVLPRSYSRFGRRSECMRKGVGVGRNNAFKRNLAKLIDDINILIQNYEILNGI
nr:MAG: hypothetical protein DiTV3a_F13ORF2 [Diabrotica toursvirus 3a]